MYKYFRLIGIMLLLSFLMLLAASPVMAADLRSGQKVTVASDEVVNNDLYIAGGDIVINGTVNGDIFTVGNTIIINGLVNGGVTFGGQSATINGEVTNGLRFGGQSIVVNGKIGRDLVIGGAEFSLSSTGTVERSLIFATGTAKIEGPIGETIIGAGSDVILANKVGGDIVLKTDKLTITSDAFLQGNIKYTSPVEANIQSGASISGNIAHLTPDQAEKDMTKGIVAGIIGAVIWKVLSYLMILLIGIILILVANKRLNLMQSAIQKRPWQSLGWGAAILIGTPIAAIIALITIVGLPLGLIALVLWGIALYLIQIPVSLLIGRLIIRQNRELESKGIMIGALALGQLVICILRLIPYVGWIISLLVIVFGLGTLITSNIATRFEATDSP